MVPPNYSRHCSSTTEVAITPLDYHGPCCSWISLDYCFVVHSERSPLGERQKKQESLAEEIDFCSRVSLVKGVSSHLKCPVCHQLIQDPRVLACTHTYCKACLEKITRTTMQLASGKIAPSTNAVGGTTTFEPDSLHSDLKRILGSSLNKELEMNLSKILDPSFMAPELGLEKMPVAKPPGAKSQKKKSAKGKAGGTKPEESSGPQRNAASKTPGLESSLSEAGTRRKEKSKVNKGDAKHNATMEVLVCPECGMHTEIPGGNISLIPYNFYVQHIMDLMTYYSSSEPVPLVYCSVCRKDGVTELPAAVARCTTCTSFLCKQCYKLHSIDDLTKLHSTLSITERGDSSIFSCLTPDDTKVRNCKAHSGKPFAYYCIKCSKGICDVCSEQDHKSHLYSEPENLREDFVKYIHDLMSRTAQLRRRTEDSVRTSQDLMSGIQLLAATQIEEVLRTQGVLSSALDTRLSVLLREVDVLSGQGSGGGGKRSGKRS